MSQFVQLWSLTPSRRALLAVVAVLCLLGALIIAAPSLAMPYRG
jgi:hypothetical protein